MSMQVLTILQFIYILAAYLGMTVLLPAFVFYEKVREERFCVRFMIYLVIGNAYLINLTLALQLLHISNRLTLFLGTALPVIWALSRVHNMTVKEGLVSAAKAVDSFLGGTMGGRLLFSKALRFLGGVIKSELLRLVRSIRMNYLDWAATAGLIGMLVWLFGSNLIWNMGYCISDMPVHTYWINALSRNDLFVAGVYPQGFHCMIYYLHEMFGIYNFVLMRMFCLVQTLLVHLMLLSFLKACCKTKYAPYLAMVLYALANVWNRDTYTRYYGTLPQEFGMIFILPSIYFLTAFFEARKREDGVKGWKVHSTRYLVYFGLSFSITLAAHFYNTMIAGIFCVAVAVGFAGQLFRKKYFGRIMLTGILSFLLAVLPMGIAFATGTPLEGSLRWGMSVISGPKESEESTGQQTTGSTGQPAAGASGQQTAGGTGQQTTGSTGQPAAGASGQQTAGSTGQPAAGASGQGTVSQTVTEGAQGPEDGAALQPEENITQPEPKLPLGVRLKALYNEKKGKVVRLINGLVGAVNVYVMNRVSAETVKMVLVFTMLPGILGLLFLLPGRTRHYGSILISMTSCMIFLYVMMMAKWFGLPALMDNGRCSIYLSYILSAAVAMAADALVCLLVRWVATEFLANMVAFGGVGALLFLLLLFDAYKKPLNIRAMESNDAITCLTNILRDNPRFHFTVCSANDELRMVENDGYHYEVITFLQSMEGTNVINYMTIPTPKIYFFIEKVPIDYLGTYDGSGRRVSETGAGRGLPNGSGLKVYMGASRYTVMSRMYYWAQTFRELYPNEMKVYYETDGFVCYELEQNPYRLFDLSIDYGYNSIEY